MLRKIQVIVYISALSTLTAEAFSNDQPISVWSPPELGRQQLTQSQPISRTQQTFHFSGAI